MSQESLPPGFRFHPTDEELLTYYLRRKFSDFGFSPKAIADVDLNKCEPWDLPCMAKMGEKEWYFFSLRDRKYPTGLRTNRATKSGYWKTTGKDKEIFQNGTQVGMKKTLVFYKGRAPKGEKSNWVMHEYRHQPQYPYKPNKEEWVVCRVFMKSSNCKKPNSSASSQATPSMLDSPSNTNSAGDLGDFDMSVLNNLLTNPTSLTSASTSTDYNIMSSSIDIDGNNNDHIINSKVDMSTYMRCVPSKDVANQHHQTLLSWPDGLLGSNASILRALQLNAYSQPISTACFDTFANIRGDGSKLTLPTSSSNGGDSAQQQQLQDSLWRNY